MQRLSILTCQLPGLRVRDELGTRVLQGDEVVNDFLRHLITIGIAQEAIVDLASETGSEESRGF